MHERPALQSWKHCRIDLPGQFLTVGENESRPRAAQGLVRGRGHDVRMRKRARMRAAGNEAGKMRHVDDKVGADVIGDFAETAEVKDARISGTAGDDELGAMLARKPRDLVHVDPMVIAPYSVWDRLEPLA